MLYDSKSLLVLLLPDFGSVVFVFILFEKKRRRKKQKEREKEKRKKCQILYRKILVVDKCQVV